MQDLKERSIYTISWSASASSVERTSSTRAQIKAFARQFDPQPFPSFDRTPPKTHCLRVLVASGWHTASITMKLMVESGLPLVGGIIGAGGETRLAETNAARRHVAGGKRSGGDHTFPVTAGSRNGQRPSLTRNQMNQIVQELTAKLIVPRRVRQ